MAFKKFIVPVHLALVLIYFCSRHFDGVETKPTEVDSGVNHTLQSYFDQLEKAEDCTLPYSEWRHPEGASVLEPCSVMTGKRSDYNETDNLFSYDLCKVVLKTLVNACNNYKEKPEEEKDRFNKTAFDNTWSIVSKKDICSLMASFRIYEIALSPVVENETHCRELCGDTALKPFCEVVATAVCQKLAKMACDEMLQENKNTEKVDKKSKDAKDGGKESKDTKDGDKESKDAKDGGKESKDTKDGDEESKDTKDGDEESKDTKDGDKESKVKTDGDNESKDTKDGDKESKDTKDGGKESKDTKDGDEESKDTKDGDEESKDTKDGDKESKDKTDGDKESKDTKDGDKENKDAKDDDKESKDAKDGDKENKDAKDDDKESKDTKDGDKKGKDTKGDNKDKDGDDKGTGRGIFENSSFQVSNLVPYLIGFFIFSVVGVILYHQRDTVKGCFYKGQQSARDIMKKSNEAKYTKLKNEDRLTPSVEEMDQVKQFIY